MGSRSFTIWGLIGVVMLSLWLVAFHSPPKTSWTKDEIDALETVFRYELDKDQASSNSGAGYFLSMSHGNFSTVADDTDPPPTLLERFKMNGFDVRPPSQRLNGTNRTRVQIESMAWNGQNAVQVDAGTIWYHGGGWGHQYDLVRKNGKWAIVGMKRTWTAEP